MENCTATTAYKGITDFWLDRQGILFYVTECGHWDSALILLEQGDYYNPVDTLERRHYIHYSYRQTVNEDTDHFTEDQKRTFRSFCDDNSIEYPGWCAYAEPMPEYQAMSSRYITQLDSTTRKAMYRLQGD